MDAPFDAGLQPERTLLAWRRTALSLAAGNAIALRVAAGELGLLAVVLCLVGLGVAVGVWILATRRYRRAHLSLVAADGPLAAGGLTVSAVALSAGILAVLGFALVLVLQ
ncbi:DUF202 domain-containing protein [Knoellia remsis]|uniref:DUF202 domain-containing protein n=1 Tax=Knoellia remsis TaxID=407159 RepID=UPI0015ACA71F|nr:DUF202 domain-containing protein [Knoellia remsis]